MLDGWMKMTRARLPLGLHVILRGRESSPVSLAVRRLSWASEGPQVKNAAEAAKMKILMVKATTWLTEVTWKNGKPAARSKWRNPISPRQELQGEGGRLENLGANNSIRDLNSVQTTAGYCCTLRSGSPSLLPSPWFPLCSLHASVTWEKQSKFILKKKNLPLWNVSVILPSGTRTPKSLFYMLVLQTENVWWEKYPFSFYLRKFQRLYLPTYDVVVGEFCSSYTW